ncbi:hypothetical protein [Prevotella sp.]|uniref:hypothetical protein n=1 Tax=Prevotella sp. TaxID=59823 RepID=UPI002F9283D7
MKLKKQNYLMTLAALLLAVTFSMGLASCSKDNGEDPTVEPKKEQEKEQKQEMEADENAPAKIVITVHDGHMHGPYGFHKNAHAKGVKHLAVNATFTYHQKDGKWVADAQNPNALNAQSPSTAYAFVIDYYNAKGEKINGQFIENGADKCHQHFFMPENVKEGFGKEYKYSYNNDIEEFMEYTYCDTNPWNKSNKYDGAAFTGEDNPLGFKGYFKFYESRVTFDLLIKFVEFKDTKFVNSETMSYYEPNKELLKTAKTIAEIRLPVNVYMGRGETLKNFEPQWDKKEADYSDHEKKIINSLAKAYNITFLEAAREFYLEQNGEINPEGEQFWF